MSNETESGNFWKQVQGGLPDHAGSEWELAAQLGFKPSREAGTKLLRENE